MWLKVWSSASPGKEIKSSDSEKPWSRKDKCTQTFMDDKTVYTMSPVESCRAGAVIEPAQNIEKRTGEGEGGLPADRQEDSQSHVRTLW